MPGQVLYYRMRRRNSRKTLKISSGSRKEAAASPVQQELLELERRRMDYFMFILPLKLALIVYIGYVLFH